MAEVANKAIIRYLEDGGISIKIDDVELPWAILSGMNISVDVHGFTTLSIQIPVLDNVLVLDDRE